MDRIVYLALGLFIGWGIGMLVDYFYWRRARICDDAEQQLQQSIDRIENDNMQLQAEIGRLHSEADRVPRLEADLDARTAQYNGLLADIEERKKRESTMSYNAKARDGEAKAAQALRNRVLELETQLSERDNEIARMYTDYESRGAQVSGLGTKLTDLEATVQNRDLEINALQAALELKEKDIANLKQSSVGNSDVSAMQMRIDALESELAMRNSEASLIGANLSHSVDADAEAPVVESMRSSAEKSDLGMIWGVNSDVEEALDASGIYNYDDLARSSVEDVENALEAAKPGYGDMDKLSIHNSWIDQSRLAQGGDWDALSAYQRRTFDVATGRDDLKLLWGIGPKIEEVMNENGIYTFAQIAAVPGHRLTEILHRAGSRFRMSSEKLHGTWPEQARMAAKGDLDGLAKYQSGLRERL